MGIPSAPTVQGSIARPAGPPSNYGELVEPGVLGVPYAVTTQPSFPYSFPPLGTSPLRDGSFVYDTSVSFEIVNTNPYGVSLTVTAETWTPGTARVLENVTLPNGTIVLEQETVSARLDPVWSNGTVAAGPDGGSGTATLPLPFASSQSPLEVRAGYATWDMPYLSPATSSAASLLTTGGVWVFAGLMCVATMASMLVALYAAAGLARRIGRSPRVPPFWPALWIGVPFLWFFTGYVSFNQSLGVLSPFVLPAPFAVAAYPYLPRLFGRNWDMVEGEGIEGLTPDEARNPKVVLPIVRTQGGLRCAPETWREAFLSHWAGLPEVRGYQVNVLGTRLRVQPQLVPVSNPLGPYYRAEETAAFWFDARARLRRERHRLELLAERVEPVLGPDGRTPVSERRRRRFSPRVVPGYLEATFPPKQPVAQLLAGVRSVEVEAHDNQRDRLENAELRGQILHTAREYARTSLDRHEAARQRVEQPRSTAEHDRAVARSRRGATSRTAGEGEATAPP